MTSENAASRPAQGAETTSENTQGSAAADMAALCEATANIDRCIAARADEVAAHRASPPSSGPPPQPSGSAPRTFRPSYAVSST
jgi:hypothetical protein